MSELQEYKCPNCGGDINFDSDSQNLKCPYCDTEFDIESVKAHESELNSVGEDDMNWDAQAGSQWEDDEDSILSVYVCQSCGGEIVGDNNTAATSCPYCDNPVIMTGRVSGTLKPDIVIPFKLNKEDAKAGLLNHFKGKVLLPKVFKDQHHIDEIKGIYVPFWLYDADVDAHIVYKGTKVRTWSDNRYIYTKTSYYSVTRAGDVSFARVPVDGSSKMEDELMESIEPYNFNEAVDFNTAYLAGFFADKYDVSSEDSISRANTRIKKSTEDAFAATAVGYSSLVTEKSNVRLNNGKAKYALYPVWLLNTSWNGNKYTFAMNGQTGRFAGNLPMDKGLFVKWFTGLFVGGTAVVYGLMTMLNFL